MSYNFKVLVLPPALLVGDLELIFISGTGGSRRNRRGLLSGRANPLFAGIIDILLCRRSLGWFLLQEANFSLRTA